MERVVVTGGAGFVGRHFVKRCLEQGYNVTIIDNLSNYNVSNDEDSLVSADGRLSFYREDITNRNTLSDIFSHEKVDTCVHLAAKISVPDSVKNPQNTMDTNVNGTLNCT